MPSFAWLLPRSRAVVWAAEPPAGAVPAPIGEYAGTCALCGGRSGVIETPGGGAGGAESYCAGCGYDGFRAARRR